MERPKISLLAGIPTLDIRSFTEGNITERKLFVDQLGHAYETIGFVAIHGHGIPDQLIENLYDGSRSFFGLPVQNKQKYARP